MKCEDLQVVVHDCTSDACGFEAWLGWQSDSLRRAVGGVLQAAAGLTRKRRFVQGYQPAGRLDHGLSIGGIACRSELNGSANWAQQSASQATRPDT